MVNQIAFFSGKGFKEMQPYTISFISFHLNSFPKSSNSDSSSQTNFSLNNLLQYEGGFGKILYLGLIVQKPWTIVLICCVYLQRQVNNITQPFELP